MIVMWHAIRLDVLVHFREPKTATSTPASPRDTRLGIDHNALTADGTTAHQRQEGEQGCRRVTPGVGQQPCRADGLTVQLWQAIHRFPQVLWRYMGKLVPCWIQRGIMQAKVRRDIDDFAALFEQRRHQVHSLAAGQRHKSHIGVTANALRVYRDHCLIHKTTQVGVEF